MECPHCHGEKVVKNGKSMHGRQRYMCRDCRRSFSKEDGRRWPEKIRSQAIKLYLEGVGFRGIERLLKVSHISVINWVKAKGGSLPPQAAVRAGEVEWVECDELCTFIGKKKDFCWLWWAIDRASKKSAAGRWAIIFTQQKPCQGKSPHLYNRKLECAFMSLFGTPPSQNSLLHKKTR